MPKVALIIDDAGASRPQIVAILRKHLQVDLGQVLKAIDEKRPVLERPLFQRKEPMFSEHLLTALELLDGLPISYALFEVLDNQTFAGANRDSLYQITTERLRTIIEAHQKSLDQIRHQSRREEGVGE